MVSNNQATWDLRFLSMARMIANWSKDPSTKVGCVIVKDRFILSTGYNGFPRTLADEVLDRDRKLYRTIHAEVNAILTAGRHGASCEGSTLYTSLNPCSACASVIAQSGVSRVVMMDIPVLPDRWLESFKEGKEIIESSGIIYDCV